MDFFKERSIDPFDNHNDFNQLSLPTTGGPQDLPAAYMTMAGPQQTRKPTAGPGLPPSPQQPTYNPRALLDPRAAATSRNGDSNKMLLEATDGSAEDSGVSAARMIENLNGVTERDDVPMKKRKVIDIEGEGLDEERKKQKSQSVRVGKGGVLSDQLKQQRRDMATSNGGPSADAIDLTKDDDPGAEVIMKGAAKVIPASNADDEEVCLGIFDTTVNAHRIPTVSASSGIPKSHWPDSRITYKREGDPKSHIIDVFDKSGQRFGSLDMRAAIAMAPLIDGQDINKMRCRLMLLNRKRKDNESPGMRTSQSMKIAVQMYCPRKRAAKIGQWLSKHQLFLRTPQGFTGREVLNPHVPQSYAPVAKANGYQAQRSSAMLHVTRSTEEMKREAESLCEKFPRARLAPFKPRSSADCAQAPQAISSSAKGASGSGGSRSCDRR